MKDKTKLYQDDASKKSVAKHVKRIASFDEISESFGKMTPVEMFKMSKYAEWKFRGIQASGKDKGGEPNDLIQDAYIKILDGSRSWYPEDQTFSEFLRGVIQSLASSWRKSAQEIRTVSDSHCLDSSPSSSLSAEDKLVLDEECTKAIQSIEDAIGNDEKLMMIYLLRQDGRYSKDDWVQEGMVPEDYDKTRKKFLRILKKLDFNKGGK